MEYEEGQESTEKNVTGLLPVADDVTGLRIIMVNVYFVGERGEDAPWVLVDAGLSHSAERIMQVAEDLYGPNARPQAIVLTHGHFDHVGALTDLVTAWDVPVYAHPLEMPYLTGESDYPPPDPTVGGGMMAVMSRLYPNHGINLGSRVRALPADGTVPGMHGWQWHHTPGHAPGHISLFRVADRTLIAGDAFVTTKQESALAVIMQREEVHGPPAYFTIDWVAARSSVRMLAALRPEVAGTGHGTPMRGEELQRGLSELAENFDTAARPAHGRYVTEPVVAGPHGVISIPPPVPDPLPKIMAGIGAAAIAGVAVFTLLRRNGNGNGNGHHH